MKSLLADARHALRLYARTPGASLIAVVGLGIAMAAATSFLSLYVDLILRPHAGFDQGSRLITYGWSTAQNAGGLPYELIKRIEDESTTMEAAAGAHVNIYQLGTEREQHIGEAVTRTFFSGVRPRIALGRGFEAHEHTSDAEPVAVISHAYWQQHYGGRPNVLGQTLEVNYPNMGQSPPTSGQQEPAPATEHRIVGVMSPAFTGTLPPQNNQPTMIWIPIEPLMEGLVGRGPTLRGIGRRAAGTGWRAVAAELNARYGEVIQDYVPVAGARFDTVDSLVFNLPVHRSTQRQLQLFLAGSLLLTIVAAANVSLFLLARAPGRRRELAIRMAVGAPLKRLARQLASEAAVLVVAAAALGLTLSAWLAQYLRELTFLQAAQWRDVTLLDWRVLAGIGTLMLLLILLVSLAPIMGLKRAGIASSSRLVTARATVAQHIAGTAQIAIAGALGGAAIAFAWYLGILILANPGYETRGLLAATFTPAETFDGTTLVADAVVNHARRREAIESLPGVTAVSVTNVVPGAANPFNLIMPHPDNPNDPVQMRAASIDDRYLDMLGLRLLHGNAPTHADTGVTLINQALARRFWGRDDVVGERLPFSPLGESGLGVFGVIEDVSYTHPLDDIEPMLYMTYGPVLNGVALIETTLTAGQLRRELQGLVDSGALELEITDVTSLRKLRGNMIAADSARSYLTIAAATLVALLAAFGFYGTQRYLVSAGRREYAIRASLGAGPTALRRLVQWRGFALGLPGVALGLPLAFILVEWLRDDYLSRDVSPLLVTLAVAIALALLLAVASIGPALQARRTQPAPLLRED